jgi:starch synthase (maltosyl-transferring)
MTHDPSTLPRTRPSRAVVEPVRPVVDGGAFPAKAACGEPMKVVADVFTDGHDVVAAAVRWRPLNPTGSAGQPGPWQECAMTPVGNDRHCAVITPRELGRLEYDVLGWVDHAETWRRDTAKKLDAGLDVSLELVTGQRLLSRMAAGQIDASDLAELTRFSGELRAGVTTSIHDTRWTDVFFRTAIREPVARLDEPLLVDVDPLVGSFGSWYEFFPRSRVGPDSADLGPATLADAVDRLDHVAAMGFDVVYLPPIHPIGTTKRKGRNNATTAAPDDAGSPWAIGSPDGGHTSVAPELGGLDDVVALARACTDRGMHLALDIAFQCSPDHPWVSEHPDWFAKRADGSIQFAENPPKKYEDIYPLDFESADWQALWQALADVFRFWIGHGVKIFRVDNPHTKAFAFWEWAIATLRREHPDTVFLAEAFTRPRVMERLAKIGFNQSYTYYAWRQASWELRQYFEDLSTRTVDYFRPNAWPNTPDILTEQLQTGGRPAFVSRAVLAATLSPSWGVYGPAFELLEHRPVRPGSEEYLDSEKYQVRHWDLDRDDSLAPLLSRLNRIRREHRAFRNLDTLKFHGTDDPGLLCFSRTDATGEGDPVLVVVNLDPHDRHSGFVDVDLAALGLPYGAEYDVVDELGGVSYRWHGNSNFVDLAPWSASAHIFRVLPVAHSDSGPWAAPEVTS